MSMKQMILERFLISLGFILLMIVVIAAYGCFNWRASYDSELDTLVERDTLIPLAFALLSLLRRLCIM